MTALLNQIYNNFIKNLKDTGENKVYYEEGGKYVEYTEGYGFRDLGFREKIQETIERPYFKQIFLIVTSAIFSSSNEKQFLDILDRYLSVFLAKKSLKEGEDLIEKKLI